MLLDNDAYVHDAYICDIQSLTMLHVCMMRLKFCGQPTNQPANKAILGVGYNTLLGKVRTLLEWVDGLLSKMWGDG